MNTDMVKGRRLPKSPIPAPTKEQYDKAVLANRMLTSSRNAPCRRCGWPFVSECACNYCGSLRP